MFMRACVYVFTHAYMLVVYIDVLPFPPPFYTHSHTLGAQRTVSPCPVTSGRDVWKKCFVDTKSHPNLELATSDQVGTYQRYSRVQRTHMSMKYSKQVKILKRSGNFRSGTRFVGSGVSVCSPERKLYFSTYRVQTRRYLNNSACVYLSICRQTYIHTYSYIL